MGGMRVAGLCAHVSVGCSVCRTEQPTDRREELWSLQRRYPGMGLWEEGKGVCCLYPISPPDSSGPMPPGGARCLCGFGGLRASPRILGGGVG